MPQIWLTLEKMETRSKVIHGFDDVWERQDDQSKVISVFDRESRERSL